MDDENICEDVLGFTKQTETLIKGLGGTPDVIKEFRKRNISTDELSELTEFDLIKLGADYTLITGILTQLKNVQRKSSENLTLQHRFKSVIEIVKNGQSHLDLLSAYIAYARLRLSKEQINFFIEPDKSLRASQALKIAVKATLKEIDDISRELSSLEKYISTMDDNIPHTKKYIKLGMAVGGLGLTVCVLVHLCKTCYIQIS
ncbi:uncharacterized protein LOC117174471 [Belonocnema kinseyi]|uniref:uncharacterized protein LOC117174471 n=1 Tax=Belonocnema kinseyi TaxID=2817044 RepID=UPI00143D3A32|nr:uncharacterized protein LOC117174471 [Belonocnema kinseyi]